MPLHSLLLVAPLLLAPIATAEDGRLAGVAAGSAAAAVAGADAAVATPRDVPSQAPYIGNAPLLLPMAASRQPSPARFATAAIRGRPAGGALTRTLARQATRARATLLARLAFLARLGSSRFAHLAVHGTTLPPPRGT